MCLLILHNIFLVLGFGVVHSALASFKSKELGNKILPAHLYRLVFSVIIALYILIAAYYWQPIDYLLYSVKQPYSIVFCVIVAMGWGMYFYSHLFYYEVGGVFGTSQLFAKSPYIQTCRFDYSTNGLKRYIRFPVHTAFFLIFLAIPTMYVSTLIFAVLCSLYAWVGTIHHDYRYTKLFKADYLEYKKNSGMVLPRFDGFKLKQSKVIIKDRTPRSKSKYFVAIYFVIMVVNFIAVASVYSDMLFNGKSGLLTIPLVALSTSVLSMIITSLFYKSFRFSDDIKMNLENSESVVFGAGVAIAMTLACFYGYEYFWWGILPNLAAIIPSWVLSLVCSHLVYYSIQYLFCKSEIHNSGEVK